MVHCKRRSMHGWLIFRRSLPCHDPWCNILPPIKSQTRPISSLKRTSDNLKQKLCHGSLYRRLLARHPPALPAGILDLPQHETDFPAFASLLRLCSSRHALLDGKRIHVSIVTAGLEQNSYLGNLLVQMYGNCGVLDDARVLFGKLDERDEFSWNFMIAACARHGFREEALKLFGQMQCEAQWPNNFVFASLVSACSSLAVLPEGRRIHSRIMDCSVEADVSVGNALVNMYGKCGSLEDARRIFNEMPKWDTLSWTAMIAAYAQHRQSKEALRLFGIMRKKGFKPNKITFISILPACASQAALAEGKRLHALIADSGLESDVEVGNALISMYGKCGSLKNAEMMFDKMLGWRDTVSWTAMIAAYSQHGQAKAALQLFHCMLQARVMPDDVTFVSILSACSHAGLIKDGCKWLVSMKRDYGITPIVDHYNCVIDLLGRVGRLEEAEDLLKRMPVKPTSVSWMTLLSACKNLVDVERGERAARCVFQMDPKDSAPYVLLSNIYTAVGRVDEAAKVIERMKEKGLKKPPGISSIEVKGRVYEFKVDDQSHAQKDEIYLELKRLKRQMVEAGYTLDKNSVLHSLEEKEHKSSNHSEMLAIAFGLISTCSKTPLLITKNLRVCPDCHSATKFISKLTCREIVVRDAHRFHHMQDGICSCADYW